MLFIAYFLKKYNTSKIKTKIFKKNCRHTFVENAMILTCSKTQCLVDLELVKVIFGTKYYMTIRHMHFMNIT